MGSALAVEPLTAAAFRPFGDVIETRDAEQRLINEGTTIRFHDLAKVDVARDDGTALVSIFRATARARPIRISMLERHPLSSQAFFPLSDARWLVVVGEGAAQPDPGTIRCFEAGGCQGVNYAAGTWHHPLLVLQPEQDFLVVDRGGPGANLEEFHFEERDVRMVDVAVESTA